MQNRHQNSGFSLSRQTRQTPKRLSARLLATCVALAFSGAAAAHHAPGHGDHEHHHGQQAGHVHQHGLGSLSVAQQDNTLTVVFESPLDSLIGFETVPETDAQKELGNKLLAQLRDAAAVVTLPAEAKCTHTEPVITAPPLQGAPAAAMGDSDDDDDDADGHDHDGHDHDADGHDADGHDHDGAHHHHGVHADLNAVYTFTCENPAAFKSLIVTSFKNWPRLKNIDVAVLSNQGQAAARVNADKPEVRW